VPHPERPAHRGPHGPRGRAGATLVLVALASMVLALASAEPVGAQDGCAFGDQGNDVLRQVTLPGGDAVYYVTRPHLVCDGGIQIWADSAVAYTSTNLAHLIGSVRYEDPARTLRAREARYFSNVGRLQADGDLWMEDRDEGSIIENGALVYLRQTDFRPEETITVTVGADRVRPRATVTVRADPSEPDTPDRVYVVEGDEILSRGEHYLRSIGSAMLTVDSVFAYADTLEFREDTDHLQLRGRARVDAPEYDLSGDRIDLSTPEPGAREIHATGEAELTGEDVVLTAERIFLFVLGDRLERLVALPREVRTDETPAAARLPGGSPAPGRPRAVADQFDVTADSLELLAPGEALERLFAAGQARAVSTARDSLTVASLPEIARSDWLEGDTIIVTFAPAPPDPVDEPDQGPPGAEPVEAVALAENADQDRRRVVVERIVAHVGARSLYRMEPSDPTARPGVDPPAVHYVVGDRITIDMRDGAVQHMAVEGGTMGVHLEPLRPGAEP